MKRKISLLAAIALAACFAQHHAMAASPLNVTIEGLLPSGNLPISSAFCMPKGAATKPEDKSLGLDWSAGPAGTQSYAVIMFDPDVVKNLSLMNKPGVTIPVNAPRMNIYHWVLIDIPASVTHLDPGEDGDGFKPGGKPVGPGKIGVRGTNDYWPYFNKRPGAPAAMKGPYGGYDGPCPPKNDLKIHGYTFEVFALDVPTLPLSGQFFAPAALKAMQDHILAEGDASAKFTFSGQ